MSNTYVVTGGAGFVGSHLVTELQKQGNYVIVIDDLHDDPLYPTSIKLANLEGFTGKLYVDDISDTHAMRRIFRGHNIDGVFHLAAKAEVRKSLADPARYFEVNVVGTANLVKCCIDNAIDRFVYASSSSVYGDRDIKEFTPFKETDPVDNPTSPYAASKRAGELALIPFASAFSNMSILRFFNIYGPRSRPDLALYKFAKQIENGKPITRYGEGFTYRDYTYIEDLCSGVLSAMDLNEGLQIINLGGGDPIMLQDMINRVVDLMGAPKDYPIEEHPFPSCDPLYNYSDITKAKDVLGWEPKVRFEEGTKIFVEWFKDE